MTIDIRNAYIQRRQGSRAGHLGRLVLCERTVARFLIGFMKEKIA